MSKLDISAVREMAYASGVIPDGYQVINDSRPLKVVDMKNGVIKEDFQGKTRERPILKVTGIYQMADEKNQNGRIYPESVMREAIKALQKPISERRVLGEMDHPSSSKINLDRVCHLITKLWMDGKAVMGESEIINDDRMPCGAQIACMLENGIPIGISSRGVGDMDLVSEGDEEAYEVQPGYSIVTFDAVAEPSVVTAQLKLMESRQRKPKRNMRRLREQALVDAVLREVRLR